MLGFGIDTLVEALTALAVLAPITTGFTAAVKPFIATRFIPLMSILIGTALGIVVIGPTGVGSLVGAIAGLGAVGLYEFGKTTVAGGRG